MPLIHSKMGIFNDLGRTVEQFKQDAAEAAEKQAAYRCRDCESQFHVEYEECPECGSQDITPQATD